MKTREGGGETGKRTKQLGNAKFPLAHHTGRAWIRACPASCKFVIATTHMGYPTAGRIVSWMHCLWNSACEMLGGQVQRGEMRERMRERRERERESERLREREREEREERREERERRERAMRLESERGERERERGERRRERRERDERRERERRREREERERRERERERREERRWERERGERERTDLQLTAFTRQFLQHQNLTALALCP